MKKFGLIILGLFTLFSAGNSTLANDYEYKNLNISANILEDGTVEVTEKFAADFFVNKHGIIRSIPFNYSVNGTVFHVDISDVDVEGQTFTTEKTDEEIAIKIGDSDKTVIGEQMYPISYTTYGLIKNFSGMGYSELYWNLVGYDFDTNINNVKAVLFLPKPYTGFSASDFLITIDGSSTTSVDDFQGRVNRSHGDRIIISYDKGLPAYRGITLAIKFPNGYFDFDHDKQAGLVGRYKNKKSDSNGINPVVAAAVPVSEETTPQPEILENADSQEEESLDNEVEELEVEEDELVEEEVKPDTYAVTSNNYVSTGLKPNLNGNPEYEYTNLDITANILQDGTMNVSENFTADFHINKHGIIRTIPLNYTPGGYAFHIEVENINVAGKKFTTSKSNGQIEIKIGDPDRTVNGIQSYPISYSTYGLIRNFSGMGYAELYWNLVGDDFDTSINNVRAEIILPKVYTGFTPDDFLISVDGSSTSIFDFPGKIDWGQGDRISIYYDRGLSSYEGITLAVRFPSDYFTFDHNKQAKLTGYAKGEGLKGFGSAILWLIVVAGLIIFGWYKKVKSVIGLFKNDENKIDRKSGKLTGDFAKQFPVIVQYEPPKGVNSAEAGLLIHREAKPKDMLSLIYKRAVEGLIKLSFEEEEGSFFKKASKNVILTKIRDINPEAPAYEKDFFTSLIRGERSKITADTNLYNKLGLSSLESYGKKSGWFSGGKGMGGLVSIGFIILFVLMSVFENTSPLIFFLAFFGLIALSIYAASASKLKETEDGARLISHVLGYREFLATCDENKLKLFLQQDPLYFDKILPYAVAFGLDTELIKKIEPLLKEMNIRSSWYDGDIHNIYYINNTIASSAISSVPPKASYSSSSGFSGGSSFGGGFSIGGGGGGGGGRSW